MWDGFGAVGLSEDKVKPSRGDGQGFWCWRLRAVLEGYCEKWHLGCRREWTKHPSLTYPVLTEHVWHWGSSSKRSLHSGSHVLLFRELFWGVFFVFYFLPSFLPPPTPAHPSWSETHHVISALEGLGLGCDPWHLASHPASSDSLPQPLRFQGL